MAKAPQLDLARMSVKELHELQAALAEHIVERQKTEKANLKARMMQLAEESGLSLDDILGTGRRGRGGAAKAPVAAKYRNPENPEETWSGRGRKPNWLVEKLQKRGVTIEQFAI
ncbi:MAG: H-NS histone family protein [Candidatus Competibacter sp.]|nr:H-NS histone family protein [Candidatus Competibacter sp.]